MQKLNCKVGDLAIVVSAKLPQNLGQIVEVLGDQTGQPLRMSGQDHYWQVRSAGGRPILHYIHDFDGRLVQYIEGPVPDSCLRPIAGLPSEDSLRTDDFQPIEQRDYV